MAQPPANQSEKISPLSAKLSNLVSPSMNQHSAKLSVPAHIGEFCLDRTNTFELGREGARYICDKFEKNVSGLHIDLSVNYETFVNKERDEGLSQILNWIIATNEEPGIVLKEALDTDFVTRKGTLTRIGIAPYDLDGVGIKVVCVKYKDVIFIQEYETEAKLFGEANRNDYARLMGYAGFKFEQHVTSEILGGEPDTSRPVDNHNQFVAVFKTILEGTSSSAKSFKLLYRSEIDAISPSTGEFIEIKTQFNRIGHGKFFHNKALKWWIQSTFCGIKNIVVGIHNKDNRRDVPIVSRVEQCPVDNLQEMCADSWDGSNCIKFVHVFLDRIKSELDRLPEGTILVAERRPGSYDFNFTMSDSTGAYKIISDEFKAHQWN